MDVLSVAKGFLPRKLRRSLSTWRRDLNPRLLPVDRVTDFDVLRRVTPWRPAWGLGRGKPIDRYYIEQFLAANRSSVAGTVLEVSNSKYTVEFGGDRVTRSEVIDLAGGEPFHTIIDDLTTCHSVADSTFDCMICTQTLQFIYDVHAAVATIHRILKPGGVLLATFPGISQISPPEFHCTDYWRFTPLSARRLFAAAFGSGEVEIESFGNTLTAVALLHGMVVPELTEKELRYADPLYNVIVAVKARKAS